ncbi:hypothetical protein ACFX2J_032613 [Malus domestica]
MEVLSVPDWKNKAQPKSDPTRFSLELDSVPNSHVGNASKSFQKDGLLADTNGSSSDAEFEFNRPELSTSRVMVLPVRVFTKIYILEANRERSLKRLKELVCVLFFSESQRWNAAKLGGCYGRRD